jgi:hypothetical protein
MFDIPSSVCVMLPTGGRQKDFVDTEKSLGRVEPAQISAIVGYAGGQVRQPAGCCSASEHLQHMAISII